MTAAVSQKPTILSQVKRGRQDHPVRVVMFGPEGCGKSTFASHAPDPLFCGAEDGTSQLDVARVEPRTWEDIFLTIAELGSEKHDYKTFVLDTCDWAEPLCWEHVCKQGGKKNIEDFGFGKGYVAAVDEWRRLLSWLDRLRGARGMNVILIAHSKIATFKNPDGEDFDRYTLKLHDKSAGLLKEWCDALLFAQYETFTHDKGGRTKGIDSGARVIHTTRRAAYDAKNRFDLPATMPLSWDEFAAGMKAHAPQTPERLAADLDTLLPKLDAASKAKAEAARQRAGGDAAKLAQLVDWARATVELKGAKE